MRDRDPIYLSRRALRFLFLLLLPGFALLPVGAQTTPFTWATLAGLPGTSGTGDNPARFNNPSGMCVDGAGNAYVTDFLNHTIRKITPGGVVTTLAGHPGMAGTLDGTGGSAYFDRPAGITIGPGGDLYVADTGNHAIRKVTPDGVVTTIAGNKGTSGAINGEGTAALFYFPHGITAGPDGILFVADTYNHVIRRVSPTGSVSTWAGAFLTPGTANGPQSQARFNLPTGITWAPYFQALFVAEYGNHTIRRVPLIASGVTTWTGAAGVATDVDGPLLSARFFGPYGIAWAGGESFFVSCFDSHTIRWMDTGTVSTVGGSAGFPDTTDGEGTTARFRTPLGIAATQSGALYVADYGNHRVSIGWRRPLPNEIRWDAVSGSRYPGYADGPAARAEWTSANGLAADAAGNLFAADAKAHTIRRVSRTTGAVTTVAGVGGYSGITNGTGSDARFTSPRSIAVDPVSSTLFVTDDSHTVRSLSPAGAVTTLAGALGSPGYVNATGTAARFEYPGGITLLPDGSLAVVDNVTAVRRVTRQGVVTTIAGTPGVAGFLDATGPAAQFRSISGITSDRAGNIYVCENLNFVVRKILPSGAVVTIAGSPGMRGLTDGTGPAARFDQPRGITIDPSGILYVGEEELNAIRRVTPSGIVTTIAGNSYRQGHFGGPGSAARFGIPAGITATADGCLYVANSPGCIFRGTRPGNSIERFSANNSVGLLFTATPFAGCELQRATSPAGPWTALDSSLVASPGGSVPFLDPSPLPAKAFYRLKTLFTRQLP